MGGPGSGRRGSVILGDPAARPAEELYRRILYPVVFADGGIGAVIRSRQESCEVQYTTYALVDMKVARAGEVYKVGVIRYEPGTQGLIGCIKYISGTAVDVLNSDFRSLCIMRLMDDVRYEHTVEVYTPARHGVIKPLDEIYLIENDLDTNGIYSIQRAAVSWVNLPGRPGMGVNFTGPQPRLAVIPHRDAVVMAGILPYWQYGAIKELMARNGLV